MNRKQEAIFMGIGILAGLALSGPAAQAATTITATFSNQLIYVDGQRISMIAYSIGGNNYVRLRDIGKAVNFAVDYDGNTNSVHISSALPYLEEATTPAPAKVNRRGPLRGERPHLLLTCAPVRRFVLIHQVSIRTPTSKARYWPS